MVHKSSRREGLEFSDQLWHFANCEFDELRLELRVHGKPVELELKPLEVLLQLLRHAGEVVTKEELLEAVWPGLMVVDGSLATAMSKLRKALGDEESSIVLTVPRVGYRLGVPVRMEPSATAAPAAKRPAVLQARAHPPWMWMGTAALVFILVSLGIYKRAWFLGPKESVPRRATASLAVLPLVNLSGDPAQEYLADGMTEELITELSKIRALKIISRTSVMQYKGVKKTLPEIARELNVDGVVEGAVLRSGNRVRITTQLIYAPTDTHLWAESYERDLGDILNLQRELARQIAREIKIKVSPSEEKQLANSAIVNPQAHDLYLKGRFFWNRRTRDALNKAADYFRQASEIDPNDSLAYAGLADTYVELVGFGNLGPADGLPKAKAAALKAIDLDGSLAEPHTALAYVLGVEWDWMGARKEFHRALELDPGYVIGLYQYAFFLSVMGKQDEAIPLAQKALELDPLSPIVLYRAGRVEFQARRYDEAIRLFRRILELDTNDPLGLYGLGLAYQAQGKFDMAILCLKKQNLQQGFDVATVYAASGNPAEARRRLDESIRRLGETKSYVRPGWVAEVYVGLGDKDEAMRWLEQGFKERDIWLALLKVWPRFDPLRSDPRFQDLLRRMNFPQ
jgi:TolB-like protein/DNA-binding winged helix-turn-helix (wHTH) protein/Flp pilus assembly protein TadD